MPTETQQPTDAELAAVISLPDATSHKYTRGVLGMLTGSDAYPGAALMSVRAAVNTGVGMVKFRGETGLDTLLHLSVPEAVSVHQPASEIRADAWAIGSGLTGSSRLEEASNLMATGKAAVIDAGAVDLAAQLIADGHAFSAASILTPHAGELEAFFTWISVLKPSLARGVQAPTRSDIETNPVYWAQLAASISGATVLLKGGTTYIASPEGEEVLKIQGASPWLATAGSGDTLTGILGALLAQHQAIIRESQAESGQSQYQLLAATAARLHALAAQQVHGSAQLGPVPPTLVAQQIPIALAGLLALQA